MGRPLPYNPHPSIEHTIEHNLPQPADGSQFIVFTDASLIQSENVVGCGWVICHTDGEVVCYSSKKYTTDCKSSNEAEVLAIQAALNQLKQMDWRDAGVTIYTDNDSIIKAFERPTALHELETFKSIFEELSQDSIKWISRNFNKIADRLSKEARSSAQTYGSRSSTHG